MKSGWPAWIADGENAFGFDMTGKISKGGINAHLNFGVLREWRKLENAASEAAAPPCTDFPFFIFFNNFVEVLAFDFAT